jgi:hypothetical protein
METAAGWTSGDRSANILRVFRRRPTLTAFVATLLIAFASADIVFCTNDCSPDLARADHFSTSPRAPINPSGDDCLCCCAHVVMAATVHVMPTVTAVSARDVAPTQVIVALTRSLDHPPRPALDALSL